MSEAVVHTDIGRLLDILKATGKKYDLEKITQAYNYAAELHKGQFRVSGDAYISHPIAVAELSFMQLSGGQIRLPDLDKVIILSGFFKDE